jgi:hypothetical protein
VDRNGSTRRSEFPTDASRQQAVSPAPEIVETTNPPSPYHGKIEEYWASPEKWQRTIECPGFSQTMVVNGDKLLEKDTGDYFPH